MKTKWLVHGVAWVVASTMLISCSGKPDAITEPGVSKAEAVQEAKQLSSEPVTLRVNNWNTAFQQAEFDTFFAEPVRKKYPFITLEYLDFTKSSANTLENLMAAGNTPDIVFTDHPNLAGLLEYKYPLDLNGYVRDFAVDLKQVDPQVLEGGKSIGSSGELLALPVYSDRMMWFVGRCDCDVQTAVAGRRRCAVFRFPDD
ncbi:MAG: extracellular solute-binding protein family 1 [Paenibacillus sp.]|nr:extracellular solute-binding protein family 1 [Paenibacillus sp.]